MSITGAALYGLLMLTNHFLLPQEKPEFTISANDHAAGAIRTLRSWGSSLPALVVEQQQRLAEQSPVGGNQAAVPDVEAMEPKLADAKTSLTLNAMNLPIETALTKPNAAKPIRLSSKREVDLPSSHPRWQINRWPAGNCGVTDALIGAVDLDCLVAVSRLVVQLGSSTD